jgi:CheY-like chemotaxis protein
MSGTRKSPIVRAEDEPSSSRKTPPRVLVVDDEPAIADTITKILCLSGYTATAQYDGEGAIESALMAPPQLLITDVVMPGMNGIELATTMKRVFPDCKIMLFSGVASSDSLVAAAHRAGHRFTLLSKPVPPADLLALVASHLNVNGAQQAASAA